jgi:hypothetical protein
MWRLYEKVEKRLAKRKKKSIINQSIFRKDIAYPAEMSIKFAI